MAARPRPASDEAREALLNYRWPGNITALALQAGFCAALANSIVLCLSSNFSIAD